MANDQILDTPPISMPALGGGAGAMMGKGEFLFLSNDSNRVIDQHRGITRMPRRDIAGLAELHIERDAMMRGIGSAYRHVIVPNKETVLRDLMPAEYVYESAGKTPVNRYILIRPDVLPFTMFEPDLLRNYPPIGVFRRDDTHWTPLGAFHYIAYLFATMPAFQSIVHHLIAPMDLGEQGQQGDLGNKIPGFPRSTYKLLAPRRPLGELSYVNGMGNSYRVRTFANEAAPDSRRILITHDSFGDRLFEILPSIFRRVAFVHAPDADLPLFAELAPDLYLNVQVERFFPRRPTNGVRLADKIDVIARRQGRRETGVESESALRTAFAR